MRAFDFKEAGYESAGDYRRTRATMTGGAPGWVRDEWKMDGQTKASARRLLARCYPKAFQALLDAEAARSRNEEGS